MNLFINPAPSNYSEDGRGSGGIWRVINAQAKHLPSYGINIVDTIEEADVVCVHAGMLIETNKPIVAQSHGLYWSGDFALDRLFWEFNAMCIEVLRTAHKIIVPSEWVAQPIRFDMRKNPTVIPHGIDPDEFQIQTEHNGHILWGKPRVDVVSDPAPLNELASMAPKLSFMSTFGKPASNVEIVGCMPYEDFQALLDNTMLWLATARETGDIASREVMARGIPVLGWRWGATAELVIHKETGYLAEPGNYEDLLEGLHYCIKHRKRLGKAARKDVIKRFDWADLMEQYASVYQSALDEDQYEYDVSIVVPAYNYAQFLPECLGSIYDTSLVKNHRCEVIVVNDASTDDTAYVLSQWNHKDLRVITHESNGGLPATLNTGHRAAKGRYISNLDADNVLLDGIEELYDALESDYSLDIASGNLAFFNPDGTYRAAKDWPFGRVSVKGQLDHFNQIPSTCMVRARSIKPLGGYRMRQRKNEDGEFWCRAMSAGLRAQQVTGNPVFAYRWHGENKSKTEGGEDDPHGPLAWNFHYPWHVFPEISPFATLNDPPMGSWPVRSYEKPLISVVIPCGPGHQDYLMDALDSVAGQTFREIECVVANDTGEPLDVISMGHPWVKVVDTPGKQGPAAARNMAIEHAKAELIIPLDADDLLYPDTAMMFYEAWATDPSNIVYSDCVIEDVPGRRDPYICGPWSWERVERESLYQVTHLFAKQWWEAVGGYDTDIAEWEDWIFGLKLHYSGIGATYIKRPWGVYRHWTTLAHGQSKNLSDNANYGSDEFKEKVKRVRQFIAEKEETMCKGCKSKVKSKVVAAAQAAAVRSQALPPGSKEAVLIIYDGSLGGGFSINSKVARQKKYRVTKGRPFEVLPGDEWIVNVKDFHIVEKPPAPRAEDVTPEGVPAIPHVEMPPSIERPKFNIPPRAIENKIRSPLTHIEHELGKALCKRLVDGGFTTIEDVRHDILTNRARGILDLKGVGAGKVEEIRRVILG